MCKRLSLLASFIIINLTLLPGCINAAERIHRTQKKRILLLPKASLTKAPLPKKGHKKCKTKAPKAPKSLQRNLKAKTKELELDCVETIAPSATPSVSLEPTALPSQYPSANPTVSIEPSTSPSKPPTDLPSKSPSDYPSAGPSLSSRPSTSPSTSPSGSPSVSQSPSHNPSKEKSPWCNDIDSGEPIYTTKNVVTGKYYYEMTYQKKADRQEILRELDSKILEDLIVKFIWCGESKTRLLNSALPNPDLRQRRLSVDGIASISLDGEDNMYLNKCEQIGSDKNTKCEMYEGSYTLYLRENVNYEDARIGILNEIKNGMNVTDEDPLAKRIDNVEELYFYGDSVDVSGNTDIDRFDAVGNVVSSNLTALGASLLAMGSALAVLLIFVTIRKKQNYRVDRMEEFFEEEESLFGKGIGLDGLDCETDLMSNDSRRRNIQILGDDDSLQSHDNALYGLGRLGGRLRSGHHDLGRRGDAVNVHKCTSATCEICSSNLVDPTFLRSMYPGTAEMEMASSSPRNYTAPDTVEM